VSQQESYRRGPEINPAARGDGASLVVTSVPQENNSLMDLAKGLSGMSKGLDTYFQLQATYGRINMEEAKIRGALGLPKGHGLGLEWGVDKGFNEGRGTSIGTKISTEIAQRLQEEDYGISQGVTAETYPKYMEKVTQDITTKYLGSSPNGDVLNGAADNIAKAKVAGEIDGYRRHWIEHQSQQAQEVMGAVDSVLDSQVQSVETLMNSNASPDPITYRDNISRSIKDLATKMNVPRNQLNGILLNSLETKLQNLATVASNSDDPKVAMKAMALSGNLIKIMESPDKSGFSFSKAMVADAEGNLKAPFKSTLHNIIKSHYDTVSQMNKALIDKQDTYEKNLFGDVLTKITEKSITEKEGFKVILSAIDTGKIRKENAPDYIKKVSDFINNDRVGVLDTELSLKYAAMASSGLVTPDIAIDMDRRGVLPSKEIKQGLITSMNEQQQMARTVKSAGIQAATIDRAEKRRLDKEIRDKNIADAKERKKQFRDFGMAKGKELSPKDPAEALAFGLLVEEMADDPSLKYLGIEHLDMFYNKANLTTNNIIKLKGRNLSSAVANKTLDILARNGKTFPTQQSATPKVSSGEPEEAPRTNPMEGRTR